MKLKPKSLTQVLLSAFLIRLLVTGASIGDALALLSLSGIYAYFLYLESTHVPEANKDLKDRLVALEDKVSKTENKIGAMTLNRR
jgi:hypothetical protein